MRFSIVVLLTGALLIVGCAGPIGPLKQNLPPAQVLMEPGPGVGGPGPGVMMPAPPPACGSAASSQVAFVGPEGMTVSWDVGAMGHFGSEPLICPGRYNFPQGAIYRLKMTNIAGRPGVELYPTLEVGGAIPRTEAFLAHNAIPVQFTEEDFDQVLSGNFVTKVIYLPDPDFQELALAGVETLVSTRLDPGVDPVVEADRRGAILGIVRLGNKDLEMPGEMISEEGVMPAAYLGGSAMVPCDSMGIGGAGGATPVPSGHVSGVTMPQWGMPISGTPIGLPGPPHIPLGVPAGLQKHVMKNHTRVHMPGPTKKVKIDVRQIPGFSYPKPASRARIIESTFGGLGINHQPLGNRNEVIDSGCEASGCEDYGCAYPGYH